MPVWRVGRHLWKLRCFYGNLMSNTFQKIGKLALTQYEGFSRVRKCPVVFWISHTFVCKCFSQPLLKIGKCNWTLSSTAKSLKVLFEKSFAQCLDFPIRELKFYNSYLLSDFQAIYWLPTLQNGVGNRDKVYFYAEGDKAMVERKKICEQNELSNSWIFQNWSFMTIIWHRISRQTL